MLQKETVIKILNKVKPIISIATILAIVVLSMNATRILESGLISFSVYIIAIIVVSLNYITGIQAVKNDSPNRGNKGKP